MRSSKDLFKSLVMMSAPFTGPLKPELNKNKVVSTLVQNTANVNLMTLLCVFLPKPCQIISLIYLTTAILPIFC